MSDPEMARAAPATRRSLARRWAIVAGLAIAALALFGASAWVASQDAQARRLQHEGERAEGTVVLVDAQLVGRGNIPNGSVVVRFDVDGQSQEQSIYVGGKVTDYQRDQAVTVVYDDADPTRVELLGVVTRGPGLPVVPPLIGGVVLAGMAIVAGRHAGQIGRAVRGEPWHAAPARLVQQSRSVAFRQGTRTLVVLSLPEGELAVEPIGLGRVDPTFEPEAWIAGLGRRTMALSVPGGGHVVAVHARRATRAGS
ncbi:MAG: DUF3592 domain-containing protein [Acidimicrobiales bacterium]